MSSYPIETIRDLMDGNLSWFETKSIMSSFKDRDRFLKYVEVLQSRMPWTEKIILPIGENLFIVKSGDERIVKCSCGQEFGDYRQNWKLAAMIHVRNTTEKIAEIYPGRFACDPTWMEIREFICPGCAKMLEVEAAPPGYPITFDFLPDLETFYRDWLNVALP